MRIDAAIIERIANEARSIDPEDEKFVLDHIEGTTDALEIADRLIAREAELTALTTANKARMQQLRERQARLNAGIAACRTALSKLLTAAGIRKLERPEATVSLRAVPPALIDGPVESLPPHCIRTKVEPDKARIKEALSAGEHLPGWSLSNGGETISMRFK